MNADHVSSNHDDGGNQDDVGENDESLDVEELMRNVAPDVLLQRRNKGFDNFETLLKLKASNWWLDSSFLALLELLSKVLPKPNGLPTSTYLAKKIICPLILGIENIHACPNHCILYRKTTNSNISVQGAMLVATNRMTTLSKIPTIVRGKDTAPLDQDNQGSKEKSSCPCDVVPTCH
jgi:hypothetical protein